MPNPSNKLTYDFVYKEFRKYGYTLIDTEYMHSHAKLRYICDKHLEYVQSITYSNLRGGHGCRQCHREQLSLKQRNGNHWNYQGGISGISSHLRKFIKPWQKYSLSYHNYKCYVTSCKGEFHIHHHIPYAQLVKEVHYNCSIAFNKELNKYSDMELLKLEEAILDIHYAIGAGVVLLKPIHMEFHKIYGKLNNTLEQLEEYKRSVLTIL